MSPLEFLNNPFCVLDTCGALCKESDRLLASGHIKNVLSMVCFWEENSRIFANRKGLGFVTYDCNLP